jgi:UDP:flavonoid glycosyltransferase YjiC (YdhE family)
VVRLLALARRLDASRFEVSFAAARFDERLFAGVEVERHTIRSLSPETIDARLARGGRIYDRATLARYLADELALFADVEPDLVVSDLRWSTVVSAPLAGVRLATLIDAYWFRENARYPIPDHFLVRLLGVERVQKGFGLALPYVLRHFAAPVNELRRRHGLSPIGELRDVLGFGDCLLFPDEPALVPSNRAGCYLGPIPWAPELPLPEWWDEVGRDRPLVYFTPGSSGSLSAVPKVLAALSAFDVDVVLSTAARDLRIPAKAKSDKLRVVESIRGDVAAKKASLVICNGGASTGWQALAQATPIVGIPSNLDACLAMSCIEEAGAGIALRPTASVGEVRAAIARGLHDQTLRTAAGQVARDFAACDPHPRFAAQVERMLSLQR